MDEIEDDQRDDGTKDKTRKPSLLVASSKIKFQNIRKKFEELSRNNQCEQQRSKILGLKAPKKGENRNQEDGDARLSYQDDYHHDIIFGDIEEHHREYHKKNEENVERLFDNRSLDFTSDSLEDRFGRLIDTQNDSLCVITKEVHLRPFVSSNGKTDEFVNRAEEEISINQSDIDCMQIKKSDKFIKQIMRRLVSELVKKNENKNESTFLDRSSEINSQKSLIPTIKKYCRVCGHRNQEFTYRLRHCVFCGSLV
ncbi:hypothetical protein ACOME3_007675 [Neoechinorhynchus agilis]